MTNKEKTMFDDDGPTVMPPVIVRGVRPPSIDPDDLYAVGLLKSALYGNGISDIDNSDEFILAGGGSRTGESALMKQLELSKVTIAADPDQENTFFVTFNADFYEDWNGNGRHDPNEHIARAGETQEFSAGSLEILQEGFTDLYNLYFGESFV